jgi:hypothetical protein
MGRPGGFWDAARSGTAASETISSQKERDLKNLVMDHHHLRNELLVISQVPRMKKREGSRFVLAILASDHDGVLSSHRSYSLSGIIACFGKSGDGIRGA